MKRFRTMIGSVGLVVMWVLLTAQPVFALATTSTSYSHVKYDEDVLSFHLHTDQCVTEENSLQVRDRSGSMVIAELNPEFLDPCDEMGMYKYAYESVVDATYGSIRLLWDETFSPPIVHGMNLTSFDLIYYLEGLENVDYEMAKTDFYVKHSAYGDGRTYVSVMNPEIPFIRPLEETFGHSHILDPYFTINNLFSIEEALSLLYADFNYDPSATMETRAIFVANHYDDEVRHQYLYMTDPFSHQIGSLLSLDSPKGELAIDLPKKTDWEIKQVIVTPKDGSGHMIAPIEFIYDEFNRIYLPDVGYYDIQVIGTVGGINSGEIFIVSKKNVSIKPYGKTTLKFSHKDIVEVKPQLNWHEFEGLSSELKGMQLKNVWIPSDTFNSSQSLLTARPILHFVEGDIHKLYISENVHKQIGWEYCLKDAYTCVNNDAYLYITEIPKRDGYVKMSNELKSELRLATTLVFDHEMTHDYLIPYKLNIYDSHGNAVWILPTSNVNYGEVVFQKYGQSHPIGKSSILHPFFTMSMPQSVVPFPSEWESDEPHPSFGLYEVSHQVGSLDNVSLPITMNQVQYLYYLNEEGLADKVVEAGIASDEPFDLQQIVRSMHKNADSDFWNHENDALKSFHIQFLMQLIPSERVGF